MTDININRIVFSGESREYDAFKMLKGNRFIDLARVERICDSIRENGLYESHIKVNEDFEIIDGQHRFTACKKLGLPIFYDVHKDISLKDCVALNTTSKTWTMADYLKSYAEIGNQDYADIIQLIREFPHIPLTTMFSAVSHRPSGGNNTKLVRSGQLKFACTFDDAKKLLAYVERVRLAGIEREISNISPLLSTAIFAYLSEAIDEELLLKKIMVCKIQPFSTFRECRAALETVYNFRRGEQNRIFFEAEYSKLTFVPTKEVTKKYSDAQYEKQGELRLARVTA